MPAHLDPADVVVHLWHGANRSWDGFPEVQPAKKGAYEHGPGIYLTTHWERATTYAKGGGSVVHMTLRNLRLLDQQTTTLDDALEFVKTCPGLRDRKTLAKDLHRANERRPDNKVTLNNVVTLCVNREALAGRSGPALAAWMVEHGVDADVISQSNGENWVVLYNTARIVEHRKVLAREAQELPKEYPGIAEQTEIGRRLAERAVLIHTATSSAEQAGLDVTNRARPRL